MFHKLKLAINLIQNMGLRYVFFRVYHAISTKIGWHKKQFPTNPEAKSFITLNQWKENLPPFFFYGKEIHGLPKVKDENLKTIFQDLEKGGFVFFSKQKFNLGKDYNWITNPTTDHQYDISKHWSEIQDLTASAGDIKFVWEKSRFSFLYDVIRYDYHFEEDKSEFVFSEIEDFIDKNPINQGPNYKCSQEISLRILNWAFTLYYYKDSKNLTEKLFQKIINAIYWQLHHVRKNIHFSRIAVRNNHAITETLMLYLSNKLFPFIPEAKKWSVIGKRWFEQEIEYQIYEDGTFLQYSMNYHRVVVQLLTWALNLSKLNNDTFAPVVYDRAKKSLAFLDASTDPVTGKLPNYGSNDGALFFKLTNDDYRNYRSQLDDLRVALNNTYYFYKESNYWYGQTNAIQQEYQAPQEINIFEKGGYYIIQDQDVKTFIKCGKYKDRPAQSDNLHLDIWINGNNILRDSGSYKYNTSKDLLNYFTGVEGHNTVSVSKENQALKGGRFIWYNWVKYAKARLIKKNNQFEFEGAIKAFKNVGNNIEHTRKIAKKQGINSWDIKDKVTNTGDKKIYQYWHLNPKFNNEINIETRDKQGELLRPLIEENWFSSYYGVKEKSIRLTFVTNTAEFNTKIKITL